jgi:hypothetical protein
VRVQHWITAATVIAMTQKEPRWLVRVLDM